MILYNLLGWLTRRNERRVARERDRRDRWRETWVGDEAR